MRISEHKRHLSQRQQGLLPGARRHKGGGSPMGTIGGIVGGIIGAAGGPIGIGIGSGLGTALGGVVSGQPFDEALKSGAITGGLAGATAGIGGALTGGIGGGELGRSLGNAGSSALGYGITGLGAGALGSYMQGQNPLKGALIGGALGAIGGAYGARGDAAGAATGADSASQIAAQQATSPQAGQGVNELGNSYGGEGIYGNTTPVPADPSSVVYQAALSPSQAPGPVQIGAYDMSSAPPTGGEGGFVGDVWVDRLPQGVSPTAAPQQPGLVDRARAAIFGPTPATAAPAATAAAKGAAPAAQQGLLDNSVSFMDSPMGWIMNNKLASAGIGMGVLGALGKSAGAGAQPQAVAAMPASNFTPQNYTWGGVPGALARSRNQYTNNYSTYGQGANPSGFLFFDPAQPQAVRA